MMPLTRMINMLTIVSCFIYGCPHHCCVMAPLLESSVDFLLETLCCNFLHGYLKGVVLGPPAPNPPDLQRWLNSRAHTHTLTHTHTTLTRTPTHPPTHPPTHTHTLTPTHTHTHTHPQPPTHPPHPPHLFSVNTEKSRVPGLLPQGEPRKRAR